MMHPDFEKPGNYTQQVARGQNSKNRLLDFQTDARRSATEKWNRSSSQITGMAAD
jgi:hypothetical protein